MIMTQQVASPEEIQLFVKTATARLVASGMTEEVALERIGACLQKRAEELGMVHPEQLKQAEAAPAAGDRAGQGITPEEYVLGSAHEKLVKAGMSEEEAVEKLINHLSK